MKIMSKYIIAILCLLLFGAQSKAKQDEMFKNKDIVCIIGDSITHNGYYHRIIYEYYITRFPERKIKFYNCGISGDSAHKANKRLDRDVLVRKPTRATIMLGMNDVQRSLYKEKTTNKEILDRRNYALSKYKSNMDKIINRLIDIGVQVTIITPSIYDQTVKAKAKNFLGVNDALIKCAQYDKELAIKYNLSLIELNSPMLKINTKMQKNDPTKSLIGRDRVHPTILGHYIMAYIILRAQNVPELVAKAVIDAKQMKVLENEKCKVEKINSTSGQLGFTYSPESIPLFGGKNYRMAMEIIPSSWNINREIMIIKGFPKQTKYNMKIDGKKVGVFTGESLEQGIDIAILDTPQQEKSKCLFRLLMKKWKLEGMLRYLVKVEAMLIDKKVDVNDAAAVDKYFEDYLAYLKKKKSIYLNYSKKLFTKYKNNKTRKAEIEKEINLKEEQARALAKPGSYKIMFEKI